MNAIGIIPARYESKRFPGKPLAMISGKSMIQRVYEGSVSSKLLDDVIVATDDERIADEVKSFGGKVVMTSKDIKSGTDRVATVARDIDCTHVVNIQGDEPLITGQIIDRLLQPFNENKKMLVTTLIAKAKRTEKKDKNVVKVVVDNNMNALYFSREDIPFVRCNIGTDSYKHIGIYAFKKETLLAFTEMDQTILEKTESLEQLRFLENGKRIHCVEIDNMLISIDKKEDIQKIKKREKSLSKSL